MAISFLSGQRLTADLLNTNVTAFFPVTYAKASATARNTTTTYADDPELSAIPLAVGLYEIELVGFFTLATTSTQKIKTRWVCTGTWNNPTRACVGAGSAQVAAPSNVTEGTVQGYLADSQDATYDTSTSSAYTIFREVARNVNVTVAGNLSLQWAQSASSANNTTVQGGTSFVIRKVS